MADRRGNAATTTTTSTTSNTTNLPLPPGYTAGPMVGDDEDDYRRTTNYAAGGTQQPLGYSGVTRERSVGGGNLTAGGYTSGIQTTTDTRSGFTADGLATETTTISTTTIVPHSGRDSDEAEVREAWKNATWGQTFCRLLQIWGAEVVCCTVYYFLSEMLVATNLGRIGVALGEGFLIYVLLSWWTREHAGHISPITTIVLAIVGGLRPLPWIFMLAYILAQPVGSIIGTLMVWALTPGNDRSLGLGTAGLGFGFSPGQALGAETFACFIFYLALIFIITSFGELNYYEQMNKGKTAMKFPLTMGMLKLVLVFAVGPISGANLNWYRYFFPAVISGTIDTSNWWVWFFGPVFGAAAAIIFYYLYNWVDNAAFFHVKLGKVAYRTKHKRV